MRIMPNYDELDDNGKDIPLEELLQLIKEQYDNVIDITVTHKSTVPDVTGLYISVWTDDELEGDLGPYTESIDIGPADHVTIETDEHGLLRYPYVAEASWQEPPHTRGSTTVYMSENVRGASGREMEAGLARLRQKLTNTCPTCGQSVDNLRDHYDEQL